MTAASPIPMTPSQKLIWMGQSLAGAAPLYNMAWRFDLHLALDTAAFAQAFTHVFETHDALGVAFEGQGADAVQRATELPPFPPALDFSDEADPEKAASNWVKTRAARPIDLAKSTFDTCLIKLSEAHWVWFFNQHHIATDAWSGGLMFKAVAQSYHALTSGAPLPNARPPQFADYAGADHPVAEATQEYWRTKTAGFESSAVPYGEVRDLSVPASHRITIPFGKGRTDALKALALSPPFRSISPDLSVFALLMTAYAGFLSRVTRQSHLSIGTPSHNRATPALKDTMGLFIEMFPLGFEIKPEDTFEDLFSATMAETMGFLRHAKPGVSNAATASSFNAVLNYIPVSYGTFAGAKTQTQWLHPGAHDARQDIRLHVYDFDATGAFTVEMDCNAAVFDAGLRDRMPGHFLKMIDALLAGPGQVIAHVPMVEMSGDEAHAALQVGPAVAPEYPVVLDAFAAHVARTPDAIACECNGETLSYRAIDARAARFAADLIAKGVISGDPVLIHAKRSLNLVAAILGVLKAGGVFVPVPSDAPPSRVETITKIASPKVVLTEADLARSDIGAATAALKPIAPDQPAYAIFTSGSTGEPKGVLVDHQNLGEYIRWAAQTFGPQGPKSFPLYSSIGFDLTLTSIFVPLTTGGRVVIYPEAAHGSDLSILNVFEDDRVDVVKLTPAHLSLLCEHGVRTKRIRTLVLGGENLTTAQCLRARSTISPELEILNEYGPTEAVVGSMVHRFDPTQDKAASVPIGRPADNTGIHILDAGLNPVPIGVTGEIYISGRLAKGYLNRPELTAAKFKQDPRAPGGLIYRTGDLARTTADGTVHYQGRADTQLKINGVRIEPAEIEAAFTALPDVSWAYATAYKRTRPQTRTDEAACSRCGISSRYPDTTIGTDGICGICRDFDSYKTRAEVYFKTPQDLSQIVSNLPARKTGTYDAIVLLSGGKDSTYALYRFADLTRNILALTLDNGFISEEAKANIRRVTDDLGIDHRFMTTPAMNDIFKESLTKHSNVCQGCFKTIYTLALDTARAEGIPAIVTGLSRGQFFETRLTPDLFANRAPSAQELDQFVQDARKSYHRMDDAVSRHLGVTFDDAIFEDIEIIDIYRYVDVSVSEIYRVLDARGAWARPSDTGRSTNCLINDVGIHVHKTREGFHNYALPYSWDVRMGHKTRQDAVEELDDEIDTSRVHDILAQIGFDQTLLTEATQTQLVVYVSGTDLDPVALRAQVASGLLPAMIPAHIIVLDTVPLTQNGKIDTDALPKPDSHRTAALTSHIAPSGAVERQLVEIYQSILGADAIGVTDNFYDIGGDSIAAIQIAIHSTDQGLAMAPNAVFEHQTIRELAASLSSVQEPQTTKPNEPLIDLDASDLAAIAQQLSGTR